MQVLDEALAQIRQMAGELSGWEQMELLDKVVTLAVTRPCACGCAQPVTSPRPEARYATGACRVRAHRKRI